MSLTIEGNFGRIAIKITNLFSPLNTLSQCPAYKKGNEPQKFRI